MIVDAHSHLGVEIEGFEEPPNIYGVKTSGIATYLAGYDRNGVDACFAFASHSLRMDSVARAENEALARAAARYPDRIFAWATVCPAWPEKRLRAEIRYAISDLGLHGLKFVPITQGVSLANPGMDIVAEEAIGLNVPVTTHDGSPEYCSAIQVAYYARKYPRLRVLSAHSGLRELWPDFLDAVRELPNLYLCLSGPTQWGIQKLYDVLGPAKLMFGSDGGCGPAAITTAYLRRIGRLRAREEHKAMILGRNAMEFLFGKEEAETRICRADAARAAQPGEQHDAH
jgi:predicted TIM-barrel fold metal-dependent hydrolase